MGELDIKRTNEIFRKINHFNDIAVEAAIESESISKILRKKITAEGEVISDEEISGDDKKDFITFAKEAIGQKKFEVSFKKIDERAVIPTYAHDGDVGMDLTAIDYEYNEQHDYYIYHTGLAFETDKHYGIFIFPRSSNRNTDAYMCNHVGIADSATYRGEIMVCFKNRDSLRQLARETEMVEFFNAVKDGKSLKEASFIAGAAFTKALKDREAIRSLAPYRTGDRIAQMVVFPYPDVKLIEREELSKTERGAGGFGSTNKKG